MPSLGGQHLVDVPCEEFMFDVGGGYLSKPGATYYLNIKNLDCPEGQTCDVYFHPYNNGES